MFIKFTTAPALKSGLEHTEVMFNVAVLII